MHWAKVSSGEFADRPAFDEPPEPVDKPPEPVDDGLLLHAAASRIKVAVAMMAATVRAAGGHARCCRRMTRVLWRIMLSSRLGDRAGRQCWRPVWIARCPWVRLAGVVPGTW
jgi:hypothetical protein